MKHTFLILSIAVAGACASPPPERQVIDDAAAALGGAQRVTAVKSIVIQGSGTNGNLGQDMTPDATGQTFTVSDYTRTMDVSGGRVRIEQTRTPNFTYFQGPQPQKQVLGIDGDVAYNVAPNGTATRAAEAVAKDRQAELYHHPITMVRAALDPMAVLANPRTLGSERIVDITIGGLRPFTLAIDAASHLPTRVVSMTDNLNLGDVAIETSFSDYQDVGGLKLPTKMTTKTDKWTTATLQVSKQAVDADAAGAAAPDAARSAKPANAAPAANVTVENLGKGIWFLAGQSHHSVLVEFADHLMLIEAPQNDTRALAVIAKARELVPGKPLTQVVNTHHHFDHSGGIRAAVSEGLGVITNKANAGFYEDAVKRSHSIVPDALAKNAQPLKLETFDEELALKDAAMTVNLYHIAGSAHADTLVMAYFPRERILVEADVYSPGGAIAPYAANLLENVKKRNLRVDRIVPIHGTIAPFAELVKTAQAQPAN
jgi:glyoxylase-like metal-dependent hydrolase (beta-lactamase superfamily II)